MTLDSLKLRRDVRLKDLTTMQVGGKARFFASCEDAEAVVAALRWAAEQKLPTLVLGGGSNLVFPDAGYDGLIIQPCMTGLAMQQEGDRVHIAAQAGLTWDDLVAKTVADNLAGIECLSGIPGKVGAAPIQNIGAYGQELAQVCTRVQYVDRQDFKLKTRDAEDCDFAYRASFFKRANPQEVIVGVSLTLQANGRPTISYGNLKDQLGPNPSLQEVREAVLRTRSSKGMVFKPEDVESHGCGSFFTNPILEAAAYETFLSRCGQEHPHWRLADGRTKLSAAWLIENSGFHKGFELGRVRLNRHHCLAIINPGEATSRDILMLKETIQTGVLDQFGIALEPEPVIVEELNC